MPFVYATHSRYFFLYFFSSVYQNVSISSMQHSFFIHMNACIYSSKKICAMNFISIFLSLAMISHFSTTGDDFVIHSMCAQNVLCSTFMRQRGIHLQFIYSHSTSPSRFHSLTSAAPVSVSHFNFPLQHFSMATTCC